MLTSLQNPLVKQLRKLHQAKQRQEQGAFLLEGTHLLEEACATGFPLNIVCCTTEWCDRHPLLWSQITQQANRVELVSAAVIEAIATTTSPDGVVASAYRKLTTKPLNYAINLGIALETLQDPGNLGTIIRTAAAVGVEGLWLSADSVDLDHPKVLRATAGQWFRLPMSRTDDLYAEVQRCKQQGIQVAATLPDTSLTYWQADFARPTLMLFGNEGNGLSEKLIATADVQVSIPLSGGVESLNVAIAAALMLYEARRQHARAGCSNSSRTYAVE